MCVYIYIYRERERARDRWICIFAQAVLDGTFSATLAAAAVLAAQRRERVKVFRGEPLLV